MIEIICLCNNWKLEIKCESFSNTPNLEILVGEVFVFIFVKFKINVPRLSECQRNKKKVVVIKMKIIYQKTCEIWDFLPVQ